MNWVKRFEQSIENHRPEPKKQNEPRLSLSKDKEMKRHHKFHKTTVEYHKDGSNTVEHHHDDGPEHNVKGAVADHDGMMDHIMDHTSQPNPGEAAANAGPAATVPPPVTAPPAGA